jgi:hypothetical protein
VGYSEFLSAAFAFAHLAFAAAAIFALAAALIFRLAILGFKDLPLIFERRQLPASLPQTFYVCPSERTEMAFRSRYRQKVSQAGFPACQFCL